MVPRKYHNSRAFINRILFLSAIFPLSSPLFPQDLKLAFILEDWRVFFKKDVEIIKILIPQEAATGMNTWAGYEGMSRGSLVQPLIKSRPFPAENEGKSGIRALL
jgi:hypothetical protein